MIFSRSKVSTCQVVALRYLRHPEYASDRRQGPARIFGDRQNGDVLVLVVMARPVKVPCYPPLLVPCAFHRGRCPFFAFRLALSRPCASRSDTKLEMAGRSWNGMTSAIFVRQKRWWNCFRICRRLPGTRANCRQGSNTRWSTSVTNFPRYPVPEGETMDSFLRKRTVEGFQNRYGAKRNEELFERAQKQVQRESAMLFIV
jgi:hypothetical protein